MRTITEPGIYKITRPAQPLPLVLDSPHSGRTYPADFTPICPPLDLQRAEDNQVDELIAAAPALGASLLCAEFPRSYIDVNRNRADLDDAVYDGEWPEPTNPSHLSQIGYGLIRRLVRPGQPLYNRPLTISEIQNRLRHYYEPYHAALDNLIDDALYNFGEVWHLNMHAMPSHGRLMKKSSPRGPRWTGLGQSDFVLGDRDGTSCAREFTFTVRDILTSCGYSVALNNPYKGVEIVRRLGRPHQGRHSLQIEINKALYWNEENCTKTNNFNALKSDLEFALSQIATYVSSKLHPLAAD